MKREYLVIFLSAILIAVFMFLEKPGEAQNIISPISPIGTPATWRGYHTNQLPPAASKKIFTGDKTENHKIIIINPSTIAPFGLRGQQ